MAVDGELWTLSCFRCGAVHGPYPYAPTSGTCPHCRGPLHRVMPTHEKE